MPSLPELSKRARALFVARPIWRAFLGVFGVFVSPCVLEMGQSGIVLPRPYSAASLRAGAFILAAARGLLLFVIFIRASH
jgi:hypothetical protein